MSGTLEEGTSTVTVTYGGKATTFNVTVSTRNYLVMEIGDINGSTGENATSTQRIRSVGYIPASETISVSGCPFASTWYDYAHNTNNEATSGYAFRCYNSSKAIVGSLTDSGKLFTNDISNVALPTNTAYVRVFMQKGTGSPTGASTSANYSVGFSEGAINPFVINGTSYQVTEE